jgi:ATP-dependent protease ClpP protease subunit
MSVLNLLKFSFVIILALALQPKAQAKSILFSGPIDKRSMATLLKSVAKKSAEGDRNITIELSSGGGILDAALAVYPQLKKYQVNTLVLSDCSSSCTVLFAAGKIRSASSAATFLFHNVHVDGTKKDFEEAGAGRKELQAVYARRWLQAVRDASPSLADLLLAKGTLLSGRDQEFRGSDLRKFGYVND